MRAIVSAARRGGCQLPGLEITMNLLDDDDDNVLAAPCATLTTFGQPNARESQPARVGWAGPLGTVDEEEVFIVVDEGGGSLLTVQQGCD